MQIVRKIYYFFIIELVLTFLLMFRVQKNIAPIISSPFFWTIPIVIFIGGIFLGMIIAVIFRRPQNEIRFYIIGQLIIPLFIAGALLKTKYDNERHQRQFGNIEYNRGIVNYDRKDEEQNPETWAPIKAAYKKLESGFPDPNAFRITRLYVQWKDTAIQQHVDTAWTIYFGYDFNNQPLFARVSVVRDSADMGFRDANPVQDTSFQRLEEERRHEIDTFLTIIPEERRKRTAEFLKNTPDFRWYHGHPVRDF